MKATSAIKSPERPGFLCRTEFIGGTGRREPRGATDGAQMRVNFKNSLLTVARHLEGLFLRHAAMLGETLGHIVGAIVSCRQKTRPNRSYPRRSRKPIGKWKPEKPARAAASA